ncbi:MAG: hypothetical protein ACFFEO_17110 [Candidatus Thorarchaeota archaeon]
MDKVVIVDSKNLKNKIKYCLKIVNFKHSSNEFVLKPNIVSKYKSGSGHITDIRIVDTLIEILFSLVILSKTFIMEIKS